MLVELECAVRMLQQRPGAADGDMTSDRKTRLNGTATELDRKT